MTLPLIQIPMDGVRVTVTVGNHEFAFVPTGGHPDATYLPIVDDPMMRTIVGAALQGALERLAAS